MAYQGGVSQRLWPAGSKKTRWLTMSSSEYTVSGCVFCLCLPCGSWHVLAFRLSAGSCNQKGCWTFISQSFFQFYSQWWTSQGLALRCVITHVCCSWQGYARTVCRKKNPSTWCGSHFVWNIFINLKHQAPKDFIWSTLHSRYWIQSYQKTLVVGFEFEPRARCCWPQEPWEGTSLCERCRPTLWIPGTLNNSCGNWKHQWIKIQTNYIHKWNM